MIVPTSGSSLSLVLLIIFSLDNGSFVSWFFFGVFGIFHCMSDIVEQYILRQKYLHLRIDRSPVLSDDWCVGLSQSSWELS